MEAAALAILKEKKPDGRWAQCEFYTALLLEALDFPPAAFTCVFAMGQVIGWIAHAREQVAGGKVVRPQSRYVGQPRAWRPGNGLANHWNELKSFALAYRR